MIGAVLTVGVTLILAVIGYAWKQAVWQTKHDIWVKAIFRRIARIEKQLGLSVGGETEDDSNDGSGSS